MRFLCPCGEREFSIADEKLKPGRLLTVPCPQCKKQMVIDSSDPMRPAKFPEELAPRAEETPAGDEPDPAPPMAAEPKEPPAPSAAPSGFGDSIEPDVFPMGAKVVFPFLRDRHWKAAAHSFFGKLGYHECLADSVEVAVQKLRLNRIDLALIDDHPDAEPLRAEIASWSGRKRRALNLVLVGDAAQSLDPKASFDHGANFYLNSGDMQRCHLLLQECLDAYGSYYLPFSLSANIE